MTARLRSATAVAEDRTTALTVAVPDDVTALRRTDPATASRWRTAVRDALLPRLDHGWSITGFDRATGYRLEAHRLEAHPEPARRRRAPREQDPTMIITRVRLHRLSMPLVSPFTTSFGTEHAKEALIVELEADTAAGPVTGWGECVAMEDPLYSSEYVDGCAQVISRWLVPALTSSTGPDGRPRRELWPRPSPTGCGT